MNNNILELFIKNCGSLEKAALKVGAPHQTMSSWRNGRTWVRYPKALRIAKYMWLFAKRKIDPLTLVSPSFRNEMKSVDFSFTHRAIETAEVAIKNIIYEFSESNFLSEQISFNELKTPILDENNRIIAYPETYFSYKELGEKTMSVWRISLPALVNGEYCLNDLEKAFSLMERTAIGIALKNFIGNRQGQRTDLLQHKEKKDSKQELRLNLDEVKGRTDQFVAKVLKFSSKMQFRQLEQIYQYGCAELIELVDQNKLAISKGASLAKLSHQEQRNKLTQ